MRDALVFNGAGNLDFHEIRVNVIRIPEVVQRVREAQKLWDEGSDTPLDLANFIASENEVFLSHIKLKNFASAIVQVGLLDRYLKTHTLPEFIVGAYNGDSPLKVAIGELSFADMVRESLAGSVSRPRSLPSVPAAQGVLELPILAGIQLAEFAAYRANGARGFYERLDLPSREVERMIVALVEYHDVHRLIMVGPGTQISGRKIAELTERDVQVLESIDRDPMLSWFWSPEQAGSRLHLVI